MKNKFIVLISTMGGFIISLVFFILLSFLFPEKKLNSQFKQKSTNLISLNLSQEKASKENESFEKNFSSRVKNFVFNEKKKPGFYQEKEVKVKDFKSKKLEYDLDSMIKKESFENKFFSNGEIRDKDNKPSNIFDLLELDKKPFVLESSKPEFPLEAKRMGIKNAKILLRFVVNQNGKIEDLTIVSSTHEKVFDESVIKAVKQWKFSPGIKNGKKVSTFVYLPVSYVYKD
ncbi:MAG: energy transducer TonB [Desulforegulaceae bacterium]|nr:energy transducer TonB [Desulforegulaceae bacterium]